MAMAVLLATFPTWAAEKRPLVLGIFPYIPPAQIEKIYAPVAADLSAATGHPVQLRTRPSFDLFRREVIQQRYDILFIQPFAYVAVASKQGYRSVARPSSSLKAVFVVRSDSDVQHFSDLQGTTLSAPPQRAAVSLLANQTLAQHHLKPGKNIRLTYQNSHPACLRAVLIRKASACITALPPLQMFESRTGVQFRILGFSGPVPGSTYAVHQRLPEALRQSITQRIVSWSETQNGQILLKSLKFKGFIPSTDGDYEPVRKIQTALPHATEPQGNRRADPDA